MKLDFIDIGNIDDAAVNMRHAKKAPDISDILPTVRQRGILVPVILRPGATEGRFDLVAGRRRVHAARTVLAEEGADPDLARVPAAIIGANDDASALEASLIENIARLDPDEVTQWETFTRLVKQGRSVEDIATTFGLPDLTIRRVLALGNLLPRIRHLYADEKIDRATVRQLTLASKGQQRDWLALYDASDGYPPRGSQLKAWLFGGQSIAVRHALFDMESYTGAIVADLFGEDRYFADTQVFWAAQNAAIDARREAYLEQGWREVVVVPPTEQFSVWDHEKTPKRKGGRVYVDVRATGEVIFHEGYVTRKEARRGASGDAPEAAKPQRSELTSGLQTYVDLHRHAALRAALLDHPGTALRLMVAHAIIGSSLWSARREPQLTRDDAVRESVETSRGETVFDERRRAVLAMLGMSPEEPNVTGGNGHDYSLAEMFVRLVALPDPDVRAVVAVVMGETLAAGSAAVDAAATEIGIDMADWWTADEALFGLIRDKEVLGRIVAEVAGETVAAANAKEKAAVQKRIVADHLAGNDGRPKVERWVPRWLRFPPAAYTERGGVGSVAAAARASAAREAFASVEIAPDPNPDPDTEAAPFAEAA